jgi:hypothetical protein
MLKVRNGVQAWLAHDYFITSIFVTYSFLSTGNAYSAKIEKKFFVCTFFTED